MTRVSPHELATDWEFKIVRTTFGAIRRPSNRKQLAEEEARHSWEMLEELDNDRVRFKRPRSAQLPEDRSEPATDPCRSQSWGYAPRDLITSLLVGSLLVLGATVAGLMSVSLRTGF
jgi:hypothetical protein